MTDWGAFSAADFDARQADRQARQAADAGQAPLFVGATPSRQPKHAAVAEQLPGQDDLFSDDGPCPCKDCRPDPCPPEAMRLAPRHYDCCGQSRRAPWCQRTTTEGN